MEDGRWRMEDEGTNAKTKFGLLGIISPSDTRWFGNMLSIGCSLLVNRIPSIQYQVSVNKPPSSILHPSSLGGEMLIIITTITQILH
jgi:hypothetical protein